MSTTVKLEPRQGQFGKEYKLTELKMHKPAGTVLNWTSGTNVDAFLKEHGFVRQPNGTYETSKTWKKGAFATVKKFEELRAKMSPEARLRASQRTQELLSTEGDIPVGTNKINTGQGVNNYVPPALPVQGALQRLIETEE